MAEETNKAIEDEDTETDFSEALGASFDADASAPAGDEAASGDAAAAEAEAQPAAPAKPAAEAAAGAKPAPQAPAAMTPQQIQERTQQLQQQEQYLGTVSQNLQRILSNPQFQAAYEMVKSGKVAGGQADPNGPSKPPQATAQGGTDPLANFKPETENERVLADMFRQQSTELQQLKQSLGRVDTLDQQLQKHGRFVQERETERTDAEIDRTIQALKADFPDVLGDEAKVNEVMLEASTVMAGALQSGRQIPLKEAIARACRIVGFDAIQERARQQVQGKARRAASAAVETPAPGESPEGDSLEAQLARSFDDAAG